MRKRKSIGIFVGDNFVTAVSLEDKRLVASQNVSFSSIKDDFQREFVDEKVLWEAIINKSLQDIGADTNSIFVSLPDSNFIFRSFEMPLMSKNEISSALSFEVEKYIPFKLDELFWDYTYVRLIKERKVSVSFVGIRKNIFKKYNDLFSRLDIKVLNLEPSSLSLMRVVNNHRETKKINHFIILDISRPQASVTFFNYSLPVFNRGLNIFIEEDTFSLDKINEEMAMSLQYFRREFKDYTIEKVIILCVAKDMARLSSFNIEGIETIIISVDKLANVESISAEEFKAYATATYPFLSYKFNPCLREKEEDIEKKLIEYVDVPFNLSLIIFWGLLGIVSFMSLSFYLDKQLQPLQRELKKIERKIELSPSLKGKSVAGLESYLSSREKEITALKVVLENRKYFYPFLNRLPYVITDGLWLDNIQLYYSRDVSPQINITGYIFLGDPSEERISLDNFISNLQQDTTFQELFYTVKLKYVKRYSFLSNNVSVFSLTLE